MTERTARRWLGDRVLSRVLANAGRLLGGHAVAALLGLAALALGARALGSEAFGVLMLVHAYALVTSSLIGFRPWHAVVRHGAVCLEQERHEDLRGLVTLTVLLDLGSALVAMTVAVAAAPWLGPWFGWPADVVAAGQWYCLVILFTGTGTPIGLLRLFDRFDLAALARLIAPALRLLGALAAYGAGGGLSSFLAIWFAAAALDGVALWALGWRELVRRGHPWRLRVRVRDTLRAQPGLWRLVWTTNLNRTLGAVSGRLSTLVIGAILGPTSAGLFQVAAQLASALDRPIEMLRRAIYPEFARLHAAGDLRQMGRLGWRAALLTGAAAAPLLLGLAALGEPLLRLTVGAAFTDASGVLALLILSLAIGVFGFPAAASLIAQGRAGVLLALNLLVTATYVGLLIVLLTHLGLAGAGFAALARAVLAVLLTAGLAGWHLSRALRPHPA